MSEKINFAIIGAGYIGKRHAEIIAAHPHARLVAVCDIKRRDELGLEKYDVAFFDTAEKLFESNNDIDVVCIATPNSLHASHALLALSAGKHVVIEKPIALTTIDAQHIIEKASETQRKVFCVMQNRYSPPAVWLKEIISARRLGKIFLVQMNCFWSRDDRYYKKGGWKGTSDVDGGTLFTQFSHFIDMIYWLFGDIKNISARFRDFNHAHSTEFEDSGFVNFDFVNGGAGNINYSTSVRDKNMEISMTVIAEFGAVKIGGEYFNEVEYCHIPGYVMPILAAGCSSNNYGTHTGSAANHHFVFENVLDVLAGKKEIAATAQEGMKVIDIIRRIYSCKAHEEDIGRSSGDKSAHFISEMEA